MTQKNDPFSPVEMRTEVHEEYDSGRESNVGGALALLMIMCVAVAFVMLTVKLGMVLFT